MDDYNDASKLEIIERILQEVDSKGSSRVGYHAEHVLTKRPIPYNIKSKLEATIIQNRRYTSRPHPNFKNDFEILKNPHFSEEKENLELQQLRSNNMLLVEQLSDFQKMKRERNIYRVLAVLGIIATIVAAFIERKCP